MFTRRAHLQGESQQWDIYLGSASDGRAEGSGTSPMSADRSSPNKSPGHKSLEQKRCSRESPSDSRTHSLLARTEPTRTELSRTDITRSHSGRSSQHDATSEHIHPQHTHHAQHRGLSHIPASSSIHDEYPPSPACDSNHQRQHPHQPSSPLHHSMTENYRLQQGLPDAVPRCPVARPHRGETTPQRGSPLRARQSPSPPTNRHPAHLRKHTPTSPHGKPTAVTGHNSDYYDSGTLIPAGGYPVLPPDMHAMPNVHPGLEQDDSVPVGDREILERFLDARAGAPSSTGDTPLTQSPRTSNGTHLQLRNNGMDPANAANLHRSPRHPHATATNPHHVRRGDHSASPPLNPGTPALRTPPLHEPLHEHACHFSEGAAADQLAQIQRAQPQPILGGSSPLRCASPPPFAPPPLCASPPPCASTPPQERNISSRTGEATPRRDGSRNHRGDGSTSRRDAGHRVSRAMHGDSSTATLPSARGRSPTCSPPIEDLTQSNTYTGGMMVQTNNGANTRMQMRGGTGLPNHNTGGGGRGRKQKESAIDAAVTLAVAEGREGSQTHRSSRATTPTTPEELSRELQGDIPEQIVPDGRPDKAQEQHKQLMKQRYALAAQETDNQEKWYTTHDARNPPPLAVSPRAAAVAEHLHVPTVHSPVHAGHRTPRRNRAPPMPHSVVAATHTGEEEIQRRPVERSNSTQPLYRTRAPPAPAAGAQQRGERERAHTTTLQKDRDASKARNGVRAHTEHFQNARVVSVRAGRVHGGANVGPEVFRNTREASVKEHGRAHTTHVQRDREAAVSRRTPRDIRGRAHPQHFQNDREAYVSREPSGRDMRGRAHTEHLLNMREAPDHARGVSPMRRGASAMPRAAAQQHQRSPHARQWDPQQQLQQWDQRQWEHQQRQQQRERKQRPQHAHTHEPGNAATSHAAANGRGQHMRQGDDKEAKPAARNPVPGVAAQAANLQPDAVPLQQGENSGRMLKPQTDKDQQLEDVRSFLRKPVVGSSEFMDVIEFIKQQTGGGVHEQYREMQTVRDTDCSHTYDASAGAARDINVHGVHARCIEPLAEQGSSGTSPPQQAQTATQAAVAQQLAAVRERSGRERGTSAHLLQQQGAVRQAHMARADAAEREAQAEVAAQAQAHLEVEAKAQEEEARAETEARAASKAEADAQAQARIDAKAKARAQAQAAQQAVEQQAVEDEAVEDRFAAAQARMQRSKTVQKVQRSSSRARPHRAYTEFIARPQQAHTEQILRSDADSVVAQAPVQQSQPVQRAPRGSSREQQRRPQRAYTEHMTHRGGDGDAVAEKRFSAAQARMKRSHSVQRGAQRGEPTARRPPLAASRAEHGESPPPHAPASPQYIPTSPSPPQHESSHLQLGSPLGSQAGSAPRYMPPPMLDAPSRQTRRPSRAPSGNSNNFAGTSPAQARPGIPIAQGHRRESRRSSRTFTRGASESPTAQDRNCRSGRQPPALANSPVLKAALAEYSKTSTASNFIDPGPFGGPLSPPTHHRFRTMQEKMAEQRPAGYTTGTRYSINEADDTDHPKGRTIPKRRPPGHFPGRIEGVFTEGVHGWQQY